MTSFRLAFFSAALISLGAVLISCDGPSSYVRQSVPLAGNEDLKEKNNEKNADTPMTLIGEKFFRESRFSQYYFANSKGVLTQLPSKGDPIVETLETLTKIYDNPYKGQAISCAACHFVNQTKDIPGLGVRAYTDFSRRSRIPDRGDGAERTLRNSPNMVAMSLKDGMFLHSDGEFAKPEDLVRTSYLGRNMGWLVEEKKQAVHHIAEVIRHDTGSFPTDTEIHSVSYRDLFAGTAGLPANLVLPAEYKIDVTKASDDEIFEGMVKLVGEYLRSLDYARDTNGNYDGSPFDFFLRKNNLSLAPAPGESSIAYSQRLGELISQMKSFSFVSNKDKQFKIHQQDFSFTEKELKGFKVFFGNGKCIQCHQAPDFTDHLFHNTGVSQDDYDNIHGAGSFNNLNIPDLTEHDQHADWYLPPSTQFPKAQSWFRSAPTLTDSRRADLGVWAVFANPAMPNPQALLRSAICQSLQLDCDSISNSNILFHSIAMMKTPTVRDLGQSAPYLHTGQADKIEDVIKFYVEYSSLARAGKVRNADPHLQDVNLLSDDEENLTLFLRSLNEDYE